MHGKRKQGAASASPSLRIRLCYDKAMGYEELLQRYPPAELVAETDPDYPALEADGGCRVCAQGEPCRDRIQTDVEDILAEAGLAESRGSQRFVFNGCSSRAKAA